ncbi:MAG: 6-phosphogluconolactonase [Thermoplasmata archaeon]|nr:6-phosphogluconolactonase [Thermoplasmata archaeon]
MRGELSVFSDLDEAARALAERVVRAADDAVARSGRFTLAISGGKTPEPLFGLLGGPWAKRMPWTRTELFWVDERAVGPDDPESNYGGARASLLAEHPLRPEQVHRISGETPDPESAAKAYELELRSFFADTVPPVPFTFDLVLLGIGPDGHTASLFPGSPVLEERIAWVRAVPTPVVIPRVPRITLTLPAINAAHEAAFLVGGADKAPALRSILSNPDARETSLPAARVQPRDRLEWFVDRAAAGGMRPTR